LPSIRSLANALRPHNASGLRHSLYFPFAIEGKLDRLHEFVDGMNFLSEEMR
jgi:hypothetical protein